MPGGGNKKIAIISSDSMCKNKTARSQVHTTYLSLIRIGTFSVDAAIVLDVRECFIHVSSITTEVAVLGGAVNQVLFAQGYQLASLTEMLSFQ